MLLELGIGDSFGGAFEYKSEAFVAANNFPENGYVERHGKKGVYTDDTQMSLAIAEALISGEEWTPSMLAERFFQAFKRDPRGGYARRFHFLLDEVKSSEELLTRLMTQTGPGSDRSGAAMRAGPIGVLPSIGDVLKKSRIQAAITHNSTDGQNAAMAASLLAHYFVYDLGPKADVGSFIQSHVDGQWSVPWVGPVGEKGWQSVRAAITAVIGSASLKEVLQKSVAFTGDVDTVACVALGAAAHSKEIEWNVPQPLIDELENGAYGRDYIVDIDRQLFALKG